MQIGQIILTSMSQALQELRVNKLRSFLSLLGITIGIFCIIAVFTMVDSLKNNINNSMASLGNDVLYINKQPWVPEEAEYKWWEYLKRKPMTEKELDAITQKVQGIRYASLCYADVISNVRYRNQEAEDIISYAVTNNFDKLQNVEIEEGRYMTASELAGGRQVCVIGSELKESLFIRQPHALGNYISFSGRKFEVIGVMKKQGKNMAGFDFDNGVIYPYQAAKAFTNLQAVDWGIDPLIMVKAANEKNLQNVKDQIEGVLRTERKVQPGAKKDFAINQLSTVAGAVNAIFQTVNVIGLVIAGFSLLVGGFGIANIMFVTVKERTKMIGLKKAIGAKPSSILLEFLVEAVTLCIAGGIIGILIVLLLSLLVSRLLDFPVVLSLKNIFTGLSISAVVGILAGYIPARAAAKLNPVVAIRSQ